ncbi:MAG: glycosyl hydrolase family 18 protein [Lachnospiraceae bacterium]|nr:glycosyl hydrolase family 18 protein [Lachnospiraceae bacterium]MDD3659820.1 glycosyl hydrolase family 18 protein [Lachnospiraceae bacterium]
MKKRIIPVIVAIVLILIVVAATFGMKIIERYTYSKERADLNEYFHINTSDETAIMLGDELLEQKAKNIDGFIYLDFNTVKSYFNDRLYFDQNEGLLLYTGPANTISNVVGSSSYMQDGQEMKEIFPVSVMDQDTLYIAIDYLKKYTNLSYQVFENPSRVQIMNQWSEIKLAEIRKDTAVRILGGIKSEILSDLKKGDTVVILEEMDTWSKVKTSDSVIGYVENKRLKNIRTEEQQAVKEVEEPFYSSMTRDHKINLVWHQVTNLSANAYLSEMMAEATGVNVISPTWFSLSDNQGNFTSLASIDYVNQAHSMGLEVWGLIDNFNPEIDTKEILSYTSKRNLLVTNLVNTALQNDLDGINIDFETLSEETGDHFIQFIRELSVACRANQLVLSIDNYVPKDYSAHYFRKEQGVVADYVIIMGYDEHYAGGGVAGSVASIDFVEEGIANTVAEVPTNKVINAVPFYTRVWSTKGAEVTAESVGMGIAESFLSSNGATAVWDEVTCQNYAEFNADDVLYQVWLEDAASLDVKLNVMRKYELGGVAAWKLGLETPDVWSILATYVSE